MKDHLARVLLFLCLGIVAMPSSTAQETPIKYKTPDEALESEDCDHYKSEMDRVKGISEGTTDRDYKNMALIGSKFQEVFYSQCLIDKLLLSTRKTLSYSMSQEEALNQKVTALEAKVKQLESKRISK